MLLVTMPHSGEKIPELCDWLKSLPADVLLRDVDRFVDQLYVPTLEALKIPYVTTEWHRYAADLNREPSDVDQDSVLGAKNLPGKMPRGFHWVKTTFGEPLMTRPLSLKEHQSLVDLVYTPFHHKVSEVTSENRKHQRSVWHLDLHSMPSVGTAEHRDPGERRADIVISDQHGASADPKFVDLIIASYVRSGFKVGYNWPYYGGKITEVYGRPQQKHHTVQVELNRGLYMDEQTKDKLPSFEAVQKKLNSAMILIKNEMDKWSDI